MFFQPYRAYRTKSEVFELSRFRDLFFYLFTRDKLPEKDNNVDKRKTAATVKKGAPKVEIENSRS